MLTWRSCPIFLSTLLIFTACFETKDETEVKKMTKSYEEAYNKGDAKGLSLLWTEDAEYIVPETGDIVKGRNAIEKVFTEAFQRQQNPKLFLKTYSVTFPKSNVAEEIGSATVTVNGEVTDKTNYKAVYENQDGKWLLKEVKETSYTEDQAFTAPTQYEHLKDLEWLIGKWESNDPNAQFTSDWTWDKHKNFLIQQFSVDIEGKVELDGKQIVAWDPIKKEIRSWIFDSDGGFGQGLWKKKGNSWVVEASHTLADGRRASVINIYTPINQTSFTWKSVGREVGGQLLPDIKPITIVKRKG